jgi:uncharacterized membrane protein
MLGTAAAVMVGRWLSLRPEIPSIPTRDATVITIITLAILFILPFFGSPLVSQGSGGTLDGLAYLEEQHLGDAAAIAYLRTIQGNEILVEAEKGDYTYYSRVSSFTGIPAVVGQPFHEFMWRGDDSGWYSERPADIRAIYEQPEKTIALMKKYNATLLYIGDPERERYSVNIPATGLTQVYSAHGTEIYRLAA